MIFELTTKNNDEVIDKIDFDALSENLFTLQKKIDSTIINEVL